jgi:hypothetical protein
MVILQKDRCRANKFVDKKLKRSVSGEYNMIVTKIYRGTD